VKRAILAVIVHAVRTRIGPRRRESWATSRFLARHVRPARDVR
jgi:hypothetical protein